jgi:hypothetical protein
MDFQKIAGHVLYAIGIIGGVEGAVGTPKSIPISVVALIVIIIGAYLIEKK